MVKITEDINAERVPLAFSVGKKKVVLDSDNPTTSGQGHSRVHLVRRQ